MFKTRRIDVMDTMFSTLLKLPLFQGLGQEDLTAILGKVKLHFTRHKAGETILKAGTPCDRLLFILKGEVVSSASPADASYKFTEYFPAPCLIEPQSLFGMNTTYAANYAANEETHTVSIGKELVLTELFKYEIFWMNYMNIISNRVQNLNSRIWGKTTDRLEKRIFGFILARVEHPTGRKILKIKMEKLAEVVNDTRAGVSKVLNTMQEAGLVELHRGEIIVLKAENLL